MPRNLSFIPRRHRPNPRSIPNKSEAKHPNPGDNGGPDKILRQAQRTSHASIIWRYTFAVVAVLAAAGLRIASHSVLGYNVPYWSFTVAVIVVAWVGGRGPSVAATALSALAADWLFLGPKHSLAISEPGAAWGLALFVITMGPIGLMIGSLRDALLYRARAEESVRQSEKRLEFDLNAMTVLQKLGERSIQEHNIQPILGEIVEAAIAIAGADFGNIQFADAEASELRIVAQRGFPAWFVDLWRQTSSGNGVCGTALKMGQRVIVEDLEESPIFAGTAVAETMLKAGVRACVSIPLRSRSGSIAGMLSAHYKEPHRPDDRTLRFLDLLARQAADIMVRIQDEQALHESQARFEFVLDAADLGAWDLDLASHHVWRSPEHDAIFGYPGNLPEWTYEMFLDHVLPEDRESLDRVVQGAATTCTDFQAEFRIRRADGAVRWMWARGRTQCDDTGRPLRMSGLVQDITDRKMAEEALRESEARLQFVLDAAKLGAWEFDLADHSAWRSVHYDELFGYTAPLTKWSYEEFLEHVLPEDREEIERKFQEVAADGADWQHEFRIRRADGAVRWLWAKGRSYPDRIYGVKQDITERKEAEEHLRHAQKLESIGLLAGGVAHDFNNLLTVIMGSADSARTQYPDCKDIEYILDASKRAANLTRQLLAYAGKGQFVVKRFDLSALVSRSMPLLSASVPKRVGLEFNVPAEELLIEADPGQIEQILLNLVINAAEAIPPQTDGRIEISTGTCEVTEEMVRQGAKGFDAEPGRFVSLAVTDNGTGIDESTLAKLFDPFFSTKFTGRGLGLAAVQGIVRSSRGFIEVHSSPGAGATFQVFLPACDREGSAEFPGDSQTGASGQKRDDRHRAVLVVDDEDMVCKMASAALRRQGYEVLEAENGRHALEVLASATPPPSLALVDLAMPVMGGDELIPILNRTYPGLKIVATSGYAEEDARKRLPEATIAGFLQKPYTIDGLAEKVNGVLQERRRAGQTSER